MELACQDAVREQRQLRLSIILTVMVATIGIVTGLWTGSQSIVFDGFFSMIDATMTVVALIVSRLVTRDGSRHFQFGYWHLEPLVAGFNGIIMALSCGYAFLNGIDGLRKGGHPVDFHLAIVYAVVISLASYLMCLYQRHRNKDLQSELLRIDSHGWFMGGSLSAALLISFLIAALAAGTSIEPWTPYVDPAVLTGLSVLLAPIPLSIIWRSVREIFLVAPAELDEHTRNVVSEIATRYGFPKFRSYVAKTGRADLIEISIITPPNFKVESIESYDRIRQEIADKLNEDGRQLWLTIIFTADEKWA
ncbi:MAG TPA: cation diffusion facilitator family transporter [Terriglobales bacterium]|nr:cation diffusion facilitator family transporter [Terriglobales bacterium]